MIEYFALFIYIQKLTLNTCKIMVKQKIISYVLGCK